MKHVRRALAPVIAGWLFCQAGAIVSVPVLFWWTGADKPPECTCTHDDHALCGMHHRGTASTQCSMRALHDSTTAILAALLSVGGVLTATTTTFVPMPVTAALAFDLPPASLRPAPPDPPPPRA